MHKANKYSKMVFYIEACEAGSMFENLLPSDINVYATTATDALVSSYACYYDSARGTYLGDEYSVAWMECEFSQMADYFLIQLFAANCFY
jgi:legumain